MKLKMINKMFKLLSHWDSCFRIMKRNSPVFIALFLFSLLTGCFPKTDGSTTNNIPFSQTSDYSSENLDKYRIHFYKIDNLAKVYVNDNLSYVSRYMDKNPELNLYVGLSESLEPGKNTIRVELYNGLQEEIQSLKKEEMESMDEKWEVYYEVFKENEPIDFIHEKASNKRSGLVYTSIHEIQVD